MLRLDVQPGESIGLPLRLQISFPIRGEGQFPNRNFQAYFPIRNLAKVDLAGFVQNGSPRGFAESFA